MSRPYQSPLDRQPAPPFASGQPPSFKTNVNRVKTKRWVEAKQASYDGDDWGDEYDEYGEYDEPALPPKATGLRQKGQGVGAGDSGRSFTSPVETASPVRMHRVNSFDAGDERRTFSAGAPPPNSQAPSRYDAQEGWHGEPVVSSPSDVSTSTGRPDLGPPSDSYLHHQPEAHLGGSRHTSGASWGLSPASETPSAADFQHRRDFSPSAMPAPLLPTTARTQTSDAASSDASAPTFPPRKSSLSQTNSPLAQASQPPPSAPTEPPRGPPQSPPIIRPSDIYKRVEAERERERQSLDSQRPSSDSLTRSGDDNGSEARRRPSGPMAPLHPGPPQHGLPGQSGGLSSAPAASSTQKYPISSPSPAAGGPKSAEIALPEVNLGSSFEDDIWSHAEAPATGPPQNQAESLASKDSLRVRNDRDEANADPSLQHQPSLGFRSAVHQAFDRADDRSTPATPISRGTTPSQSEGGVSRSNTDSTAGISPIMSRFPSSAAHAAQLRTSANKTPAIEEEPSEAPVPEAKVAPTTHRSGTHRILRKPSPAHSRNVSNESIPSSVKIGYRRDLNTPSPNNSPARSPAISPAKGVGRPLSGELNSIIKEDLGAEGRPPPSDYATREEDIAAAVNSSPDDESFDHAAAAKGARDSFAEAHGGGTPSAPASRSDSPTKSRVRDLAERFGATSESRRGSAQSNTSGRSVPLGAPGKDADAATRFRPQLPGQWESYNTMASVSSVGTVGQNDVVGDGAGYQARAMNAESPERSTEEVDLTPTTAKHPVEHRDSPENPSSPLDAVKAAGAVLGESIQATLFGSSGAASNDKSSSPDSSSEPKSASGLRPTNAGQGDSDSDVPADFPSASRRTTASKMSTDDSDNDLESDRLRKEIARSLTPAISSEDVGASAGHPSQQLHPGGRGAARDSSTLPSEYAAQGASSSVSTSRPQSAAYAEQTSAPPMDSQIRSDTYSPQGIEQGYAPRNVFNPEPGLLNRRESWESAGFSSVGASPPVDAPVVSPLASEIALASERSLPLHVVNDGASAHGPRSFPPTPAPEDFSAVPDAHQQRLSDSPIDQHSVRRSSMEGLQVVAPYAEPSVPSPGPQHDGSRPPLVSQASSSLPARIPPFREVLALKSAEERISTFNTTRAQFATMAVGLEDWLSTTLAAHPEHASVTSGVVPPTIKTSGLAGPRHKTSPSIARFTKSDAPESTTNLPATGGPSSADPSAVASPTSGKLTGQQMQARGKEFLHTAGVLGGKANKGAKGLFAKGKSRFGRSGEKVRRSSDASTASAGTYRSPFRRSSARPQSLILPKSNSDFGSVTDFMRSPLTASALEDHRRTSYQMRPWDTPPLTKTPEREVTPERLGILPSPATETFLVAATEASSRASTPGSDSDRAPWTSDRGAAPPVPEIPQKYVASDAGRSSDGQHTGPSRTRASSSVSVDHSNDPALRQRVPPARSSMGRRSNAIWSRAVSESIEHAVFPMMEHDDMPDESWLMLSPDDEAASGAASRTSFADYLNQALPRSGGGLRLPTHLMEGFMKGEEWKIIQQRSPVDTPDSWEGGSIGVFPPVPSDGIAAKLAEGEQTSDESSKEGASVSSRAHGDPRLRRGMSTKSNRSNKSSRLRESELSPELPIEEPAMPERAKAEIDAAQHADAVASTAPAIPPRGKGDLQARKGALPPIRTQSPALNDSIAVPAPPPKDADTTNSTGVAIPQLVMKPASPRMIRVQSPTLGRERPLSFTPLPRDPSGGAPQDEINRESDSPAPEWPKPLSSHDELYEEPPPTAGRPSPESMTAAREESGSRASTAPQPPRQPSVDQSDAASIQSTSRPVGLRAAHIRTMSHQSQAAHSSVSSLSRQRSFENPRPSPKLPTPQPSLGGRGSPQPTGLRHRNVMEAAAASQHQRTFAPPGIPHVETSWAQTGSLQKPTLVDVRSPEKGDKADKGDKKKFRNTLFRAFNKVQNMESTVRGRDGRLGSVPEATVVHESSQTPTHPAVAPLAAGAGGKKKRFSGLGGIGGIFNRSNTTESVPKDKRPSQEEREAKPPSPEKSKSQLQQLRTVYHWPQHHGGPGGESNKSPRSSNDARPSLPSISSAAGPSSIRSMPPPQGYHRSTPSPAGGRQTPQPDDENRGVPPPPGGYYAPHNPPANPEQPAYGPTMSAHEPTSLRRGPSPYSSQTSQRSHSTQSDYGASPLVSEAYWNLRSPTQSQSQHGPGYASSSALPSSPMSFTDRTSRGFPPPEQQTAALAGSNGEGFASTRTSTSRGYFAPRPTPTVDPPPSHSPSTRDPRSDTSTGSFHFPSPSVFASPPQPPSQPQARPHHPLRMGSITETAQHQERPWNISLPAGGGGARSAGGHDRASSMASAVTTPGAPPKPMSYFAPRNKQAPGGPPLPPVKDSSPGAEHAAPDPARAASASPPSRPPAATTAHETPRSPPPSQPGHRAASPPPPPLPPKSDRTASARKPDAPANFTSPLHRITSLIAPPAAPLRASQIPPAPPPVQQPRSQSQSPQKPLPTPTVTLNGTAMKPGSVTEDEEESERGHDELYENRGNDELYEDAPTKTGAQEQQHEEQVEVEEEGTGTVDSGAGLPEPRRTSAEQQEKIVDDEDDDIPVMRGVSYPGMEWQPVFDMSDAFV